MDAAHIYRQHPRPFDTGILPLSEPERAFIDEWARSFPYNRYRNYPLISATDAARVLADAAAETGPDVVRLWRFQAAVPVGLIRVVELPWDTELYGRRMGRITHLCGDLDTAAVTALLDETPFDHLAVRVDASDLGTQRLLTEAGFFKVDSILRYLHHRDRGDPPEPAYRRSRLKYTFRPYEPTDREGILRITAQSYARFPGRYTADPSLRKHSADRYLRWAQEYVDGMADTIWVSESNRRVMGYLAFRYDRRLYETLGLGCYGSGLGASRGGDYLKLCRHALVTTTDIDWRCAEFETQIDNYAVHRIYRDLKLDYVHAEHTYHLHRT